MKLLDLIVTRLKEVRKRDDLVGMPFGVFAEQILGVTLWSRQIEIAEAIERGDRRISVKTGHGIGKTFVLACVTCWLLACVRPHCVVVTTAPSGRQVRDQLWREIRQLWNNRPQLRAMGEALTTKIDLGDKHYATGIATNKAGNAQRFQGIHAEKLVVIVDEANGFPEYLYQQIDSCLVGSSNQLVQIGNPVLPFGRFFNSFKNDRVTQITVSSREHPNVIEGREVIPGAVTREWIEDIEKEYASSPEVIDSRVNGNFPTSITNGIISRDWLEEARSVTAKTLYPRVLSVDIARFGVCLCVASRLDGQRFRGIVDSWGQQRLTYSADRIFRLYEADPVDCIVIDDSSVGGGVTDILADKGLPVYGFLGGSKASNPEKFNNKNSEAWWKLREALEEKLFAYESPDDELELQLISRLYSFRGSKQIVLEPKEDYVKRTGFPSPDQADSLVMGIWKVMTSWSSEAA